jgi:hypothetical protein
MHMAAKMSEWKLGDPALQGGLNFCVLKASIQVLYDNPKSILRLLVLTHLWEESNAKGQ